VTWYRDNVIVSNYLMGEKVRPQLFRSRGRRESRGVYPFNQIKRKSSCIAGLRDMGTLSVSKASLTTLRRLKRE